MKTTLTALFAFILLQTSVKAEVLLGQSVYNDSFYSSLCRVDFIKDEKTADIFGFSVEAIAKTTVNFQSATGEGKEALDFSRAEVFQAFHFTKQTDTVGEGFALTGKRNSRDKKTNITVYLHVDQKNGQPSAVQLVQQMQSLEAPSSSSKIEKSCRLFKR